VDVIMLLAAREIVEGARREQAAKTGWTVASIKNDWTRVF
jgi:hypothetical protein